MTKIAPIGGTHRSARSLLAEIMNHPNMKRCVVVTIAEDGSLGWGHYEMTGAELTYAAALLNRLAFGDDE